MSGYTQLTQDKRYQICAFLEAGFSQTDTAKQVGVHKSIVSCELSRNQGQRGYRPRQAQTLAMNRRKTAHRFVKMKPTLIALIEYLIGLEWSPEQIAGFLKKRPELPSVSHETIYQHILKDKANGKEFAHHHRISKKLQSDFFFAHPYHSWEPWVK